MPAHILTFILVIVFSFSTRLSALPGEATCRPAAIASLARQSFRLLWETPVLKAEALRFFQNGLLAQAPTLKESFVAEVERLMAQEPALHDGEIYAALAAFIAAHQKEFTDAYGGDIDLRRERRTTQLMMLAGKPPTSVLDIGAGNGKMLARLGERWSIPKEKMFAVEVTKYQDTGNVTWLEYEPGGHIPLPDGAVDFASLLMVLHHTEEPDLVLKEARRVLVTGGTLVIREHDAKGLGAMLFNGVMDELFYRVFNDGLPVPMPHTYKPKAQWAKLFEASGFEVAQVMEPEPDNPFLPVFFVLRKR